MAACAPTKNELSDIINVAIESLIKHRFELPLVSVLLREAKSQRAAANQSLFNAINNKLSETDRTDIDALFLVEKGLRISPWNELKADAPKATIGGLREFGDWGLGIGDWGATKRQTPLSSQFKWSLIY